MRLEGIPVFLFSETVAVPFPFLTFHLNSLTRRSSIHPCYPATAIRVEAAGGIDLLTNRGRIIRKNHDGLHLICVEINFREETRKHQKKKVLFVTVGSAWEEDRRKRGMEDASEI